MQFTKSMSSVLKIEKMYVSKALQQLDEIRYLSTVCVCVKEQSIMKCLINKKLCEKKNTIVKIRLSRVFPFRSESVEQLKTATPSPRGRYYIQSPK